MKPPECSIKKVMKTEFEFLLTCHGVIVFIDKSQKIGVKFGYFLPFFSFREIVVKEEVKNLQVSRSQMTLSFQFLLESSDCRKEIHIMKMMDTFLEFSNATTHAQTKLRQ
jgi:hypothetical protein